MYTQYWTEPTKAVKCVYDSGKECSTTTWVSDAGDSCWCLTYHNRKIWEICLPDMVWEMEIDLIAKKVWQ